MTERNALLDLADSFSEAKEKGTLFNQSPVQFGSAINSDTEPRVYAEVLNNQLHDLQISPLVFEEYIDHPEELSILITLTIHAAFDNARGVFGDE